jgi:hypothetical protein
MVTRTCEDMFSQLWIEITLACVWIAFYTQQITSQSNNRFVSDSPYLNVFDQLDRVHHQIEEEELVASMENISYHLLPITEQCLPNGKKLVQLDFQC